MTIWTFSSLPRSKPSTARSRRTELLRWPWSKKNHPVRHQGNFRICDTSVFRTTSRCSCRGRHSLYRDRDIQDMEHSWNDWHTNAESIFWDVSLEEVVVFRRQLWSLREVECQVHGPGRLCQMPGPTKLVDGVHQSVLLSSLSLLKK